MSTFMPICAGTLIAAAALLILLVQLGASRAEGE